MKIQEYFYVNGRLQSQDYYNALHCFLSRSNYSYSIHIHIRKSLLPYYEGFGNHYNIYFDDEDEVFRSFEYWNNKDVL